MVALDVVVVLRLLHHDHLVDTALPGGGNGADVEGDVVLGLLTPAALPETGRRAMLVIC